MSRAYLKIHHTAGNNANNNDDQMNLLKTSLQSCPCCPETSNPKGYFFKNDISFKEDLHMDLGYPSEIKYLDTDLGNSSEFVQQLASNYACCNTFKVLNEKGAEILENITRDMHAHVIRTSRYEAVRGGTFRSQFLYELGHSPSLLKLVSRLAGCELIYHPMRIHQLHINYKPQKEEEEDGKIRSVDRWHCDTTPFVLVLFATSPEKYKGGRLEYYNGTREEGTSYFKQNKLLPQEKVMNVGHQGKGYGVFMQGSRVYHQVTPVLQGKDRTTLVFSFQPSNPLAKECISHLAQTYNERDPLAIICTDWARFHAWKTIRRLDVMHENININDPELIAAMVECKEKMNIILRKLPYMLDRKGIENQLKEAIRSVNAYVNKMNWGNTINDDNTISDEGNMILLKQSFQRSKYGLQNLKCAIQEVEICIDDVLNIQAGAMEYF
tara:strand:- start:34 stop:1350 length:1317 start_codon:yes stop_codon:yes gene_type:complete